MSGCLLLFFNPHHRLLRRLKILCHNFLEDTSYFPLFSHARISGVELNESNITFKPHVCPGQSSNSFFFEGQLQTCSKYIFAIAKDCRKQQERHRMAIYWTSLILHITEIAKKNSTKNIQGGVMQYKCMLKYGTFFRSLQPLGLLNNVPVNTMIKD